jgi:tetrahydromethanopterin S-methyltransferase subunit B
MRYEEKRLKYINSLMDTLNDLVSGIYESLVDYDYDSVNENINKLKIEIDDLTKTISNEI